jgi:serine protease Do
LTVHTKAKQFYARPIRVIAAAAMGLVVVFSPLAASARGAPDSFADLAQSVSDAVVNITTATLVPGGDRRGPMVPEGSPLEDFFRDFMDRRGPQEDRPQRRGTALGSGFVISADGYIVTNNHVIDKADEIQIEFFNGEELEATVVGTDPNTDIALLKVETDTDLPFVEFGNSDAARVGDWVMAVGNPLGQGFSVSAGIVSARNRALSGTYDDYIQTDAAINRGNSGGPLFNMDGQVIGVNTAILSPNGGSIGIGFAMSSAVVEQVVAQLQEFGETRRGWLGVRIQDVTDDMAEALELADAAGAMVTDVPDGPAKDAGILAGDVIMTFDGRDIVDTRQLVRVVANTAVGKAVDVVVLREGDEVTLSVTLGRREEVEREVRTTQEKPSEPATTELLGMTIGGLDDDMRSALDMAPGAPGVAVLAVEDGSEAYDKGLRQGDVITQVAQQDVTRPAQVDRLINEAREAGRKSVLLLVRRSGEPRFVALKVN